jgi:hypothetical protein
LTQLPTSQQKKYATKHAKSSSRHLLPSLARANPANAATPEAGECPFPINKKYSPLLPFPVGQFFCSKTPSMFFSMIFTYECYHIHHFLGQHPVLPSVDSSTGRDIPDVHFGLREVALVLQQMSSHRSPTEATHIRHHVLLAETHQAQVRTLLDKKQCKRCFFRSGMIWFILKENT